ncbi:MAG: AraC family transcriptional regulator [Akkermansiaceae bacterium]|jgi:AraC-like DNA-binding protein|nr:AraC family transcriptional regulator [Akkermansiaceae bacterium]
MNHTNKLRTTFLKELPREQLLMLFDLVPNASFFLKNTQGQFIALNRRGCEFCGVSNESGAIGKTDYDFFQPDRAKAYQEDDYAVMTSGEPVFNRIEALPESIRSPRLVITSKIPVRDAKGNVIGVAGFSRRVEEFRDHSGMIGRFAKVVSHLHNHYGEPIATPALARMAGISESQFNRRFRQAFGTSARQYLLQIRVDAAIRKLQESNETVSTIALDCGFHDHAHFSRSFQRIMHCSPSDYRKRIDSILG